MEENMGKRCTLWEVEVICINSCELLKKFAVYVFFYDKLANFWYKTI